MIKLREKSGDFLMMTPLPNRWVQIFCTWNPFFGQSYIITDGRTANAQFLEMRLKRNWQVLHDPFGDRTIFRLAEPALSVVSKEHIDFRLRAS